MSTYSDCDDDLPKGHIKLKEGIDIDALISEQGDTFQINFDTMENNEDEAATTPALNDEIEDTMIKISQVCMGGNEDDEDAEEVDTLSPFENLAQSMHNVTEDGKIKKKIKKNGIGSTPPALSVLSIKYSSYLEYNDSPTDSAFMSKPFRFRLGSAAICGLNIAVQSMRVNEVAWFLIHPDYAYGRMGHPPRIPPNATFLFYIELQSFVDSGPILELETMSSEDRRKFSNVYVSAHGLMESAKDQFKRNIKLSIRDYNKAKTLLEECSLSSMDEQEKQQRMLCKIYCNLAVCYTQDNTPKKACSMCNNIFAMAKNTSLNIPAKVYFHNGRALKMLGEYTRAKEKLLKAQKIDPSDKLINNELKEVFEKLSKENEREKDFAQAFFQNKKTGIPPKASSSALPEEQNNEFRLEIRKQCLNLNKNPNCHEFKLPWGLEENEYNIAKEEARKTGLVFRQVPVNDALGSGQIIYMISKS